MLLLDLNQTDPRSILDTEEKIRGYLCINCFQKLTHPDFLARIVDDKSHHTFSNPGGFVYNLLTFSFCEGYREVSLPELRDTWFPGYSWVVINCSQCGNLLGWKFIQPGAAPPEFFGLIREQIILS